MGPKASGSLQQATETRRVGGSRQGNGKISRGVQEEDGIPSGSTSEGKNENEKKHWQWNRWVYNSALSTLFNAIYTVIKHLYVLFYVKGRMKITNTKKN